MKKKLPPPNVLYLVSASVSSNMLAIIQQAVSGGCKIIQLRDKQASNQDFIHKRVSKHMLDALLLNLGPHL